MKSLYKSVKYTQPKWDVIKELANQLSAERGTDVSLADASVEASKRLLEERMAAGTPGGKVAAGNGDTQARPKGVITK